MEILKGLFLSVYAHVHVGTHMCGHVEPKHWHWVSFSIAPHQGLVIEPGAQQSG